MEIKFEEIVEDLKDSTPTFIMGNLKFCANLMY